MTKIRIRSARMVLAASLLPLLSAADRPALLSRASGGAWELSGLQGSDEPRRVCVGDPALLTQVEHRGSSCTRVVIRDTPRLAEVHYTCSGGGFGRSTITMITPRSFRIETQGISDNAPFHYVVQARRVGGC